MSAGAWLELALRPAAGAGTVAALVEELGSAAAVAGADIERLMAAGLSRRRAQRFVEPVPLELRRRTDAWLERPGHRLVTPADPTYPPALRELTDPPMALFVVGDPDYLPWPGVAVVGSRRPSPAGREIAEELGRELARAGLVVVSGLALGTDGAAHRGAVAVGGPTVGVLGCGPDRIYPRRNAELAEAVAGAGAVISEFPPGTGVARGHFPRRNRIIAGMTRGTTVVEAAMRSGSLITARLASEAGREVLAVPGPVRSPTSRGCHRLIREGAKLVEGVEDILEEVAPGVGAAAPVAGSASGSAEEAVVEPEAQKLLGCLGFEPESVDNLVERSGLTADTVSAMLIRLELQGVVESAPGGRFSRVATGARP
ncbi:MAG: DNA-processing protein DprA [Pseudomonadota bacterium]